MGIRFDDVDLQRDRALVERFQAGDLTAFDELYQRYHLRLLRFCLKRVRERDTAEEIAQEAFTRAFGAMSTFNGDRRFYPWVTVIASRLCVDHYRRLARVEATAHIDPGASHEDQEAVVLAAVDSELVTKAMDRLRTRQQDVLRLREVEGWSYQQIADKYGVSSGTVDALLFRARKALRREFAAVGGQLAALPVLGVLVRAASRTRSRIAPWFNLTPSGAVAAAATAVTATAALTLATVPPSSHKPPPTVGVHLAPTSKPLTNTATTSPTSLPTGARGPETTVGSPSSAPSSSTTTVGAVPGLPVQGLLGSAVTIPAPLSLPGVPTTLVPTVPTIPGPLGNGPVGQTVTSIQQQLSGH